MKTWDQRWLISIWGLGLLIASCSDLAAKNPDRPDSATPALKSIAATQSYRQTTIVEGLERPWAIAWLPDGTMLITEKAGRVRIVRNGKLDPTPISGVPSVLTTKQAGLLDISLHPKFAKNRWVYLTYAHGTTNANRTRVARAIFDGKSFQDLRVIFEVSQPKSDGQHFGSRLAWLADGTMLVSIGDGGNPPVQLAGNLIRQQAQNLQSHLGKILRLKDDGSIPTDNPFVGKGNAEPAVWSYGHRNIQGLTFDPIARRVWATEHGAQGGDELNLVKPGQNYGWPIVTYSQEYTGGEISQDRSRKGMIDPLAVWTPATAPSGLAVYRGDRFPAWKGNLFVGGLVSADVRRIELDASGKAISEQQIAIGQRVRDVRQGPDGLIYILTDESNGRLLRLEPQESAQSSPQN